MGRRTIVWRLKSLSSSSLNACADAVTEECAVGDDDGGTTRFRLAPEFSHDELEKEKGGFGGLLVFGEVAEDAALSSPPNGALVMMISTRSLSPISRSRKRRLFNGSIFGDSKPCKTKFV